MTNEQRVLGYLERIAPRAATNSEISRFAEVQPHPQVYMITKRLVDQGRLKAGRDGHEWRFWVEPKAAPSLQGSPPPISEPTPAEIATMGTAARNFETLAREVMSAHYGTKLTPRRLTGVPKIFDLVSTDGTIVGDAKHFSLVKGSDLPPAKFSMIAEDVWLLERTECAHPFLVFGNDRRVPIRWLEKYGHLRQRVEFFFVDGDGRLTALS
jgi:hypothetical protein